MAGVKYLRLFGGPLRAVSSLMIVRISGSVSPRSAVQALTASMSVASPSIRPVAVMPEGLCPAATKTRSRNNVGAIALALRPPPPIF
ncbi:MAG: hypothetical protein ACJA1L_000915 [Paracoccaceae bacterium]|jgi:hypothetical protein